MIKIELDDNKASFLSFAITYYIEALERSMKNPVKSKTMTAEEQLEKVFFVTGMLVDIRQQIQRALCDGEPSQ
jgi:hypothetical protein